MAMFQVTIHQIEDGMKKKEPFVNWLVQLHRLIGQKNWHLMPGNNELFKFYEQGKTPEYVNNYYKSEWARIADLPC